jgi:predicted ribosomally synthesized peptide with nif11-like leader
MQKSPEDNVISIEAARDFLKRVETDHSLRERLETAPDLESRQRIIQTVGGDFTWEEFQQAVEEMVAAGGQELTLDDLEGITGGAGGCACKGPQYNYLKL